MPTASHTPRPVLLVAYDAPRGQWLDDLRAAHSSAELALDPTDRIDTTSLAENFVLRGVLRKTKDMGGRLHLIGLISDGGAESCLSHLFALIDVAQTAGVRVIVHALLDGVDVPAHSASGYLEQLEAKLADGVGRIGTVSGRAYGMDMDGHWERIGKVYQAIVADSVTRADSALAGVKESCAFGNPETFVEPFLAFDYPGVSPVDSAIHCNFGSDGARQLSQALAGDDFPHFMRKGGKAPFAGRFASMVPVGDFPSLPTLFPRAPDPLAVALEALDDVGARITACDHGDAGAIADAAVGALRGGASELVVADFGNPGNPARTPPGEQRRAALDRLMEVARTVACDVLVLGGRDGNNRVPIVDASGRAAALPAGGCVADLGATLCERLGFANTPEAQGASLSHG